MIASHVYDTELEEQHWWFRGRRHIVAQFLKRIADGRSNLDILEIGCGSGGNLPLLEQYGTVTGLDNDPLAVAVADAKLGDATALPWELPEFDVVVALDVFEHVEWDVQAMREACRVLRPGGKLLLTVPARMDLWSHHDEALDHVLRYDAKSLRVKLWRAGLEVEHLTHTLSSLLPAVWLTRRIRPSYGLHGLPAWLNEVLLKVVQAEALLLQKTALPFGVSILAIASKPLHKVA